MLSHLYNARAAAGRSSTVVLSPIILGSIILRTIVLGSIILSSIILSSIILSSIILGSIILGLGSAGVLLLTCSKAEGSHDHGRHRNDFSHCPLLFEELKPEPIRNPGR